MLDPMAEKRKIYPSDRIPGLWATDVDVHRSVRDFTIDFFREDPSSPPPGDTILVSRVAMSPWTVRQFLDELETHWERYLRGMLPPEVWDEGQ
jgi:hypothetical protein